MPDSDTAPVRVSSRAAAHGRHPRGAVAVRRWQRPVVAAMLVLTLVVDLALVVAGAVLLWRFAGSTVVDGPFWLRACVFVLLTVLFGVRTMTQRSLVRRLNSRSVARLRAAGVLLATHAAFLVVGLIAWARSGNYFLGWVVCFAASVMAVGYFWMLVSCLAVEQALSMVVLRLLGMVVGLAGLIATVPIHEWADGIIESIIVLLSGAILLSAITLFWKSALAEDTAREVGGDS